ncbi:serine protease [Streptomyces viridochromogenes]|uniref:serine protease n=1 Tax=Streptomyces viridochromogenes TaxID=1938 RepID=UPI00069DD7EF|nr:serine protease [Streptomyces viridochromogenes]
MIGGSVLDRVVVVWGNGQGSGVLLDRREVLTAWHVVAGSPSVEVIHPASGKPVQCFVDRVDETLDVALLTLAADVLGAEHAVPLGRIRCGDVRTRDPLPHCQIVGFPQVQRYGERGEDLEYDQYRATVLPMAGRMRDMLVCELDRPAADERGHAASPLSGLSGAPVLAGRVLLGVVTQVPRDRHHLRIEAVPVTAVAQRDKDRFVPLRERIRLEEITDFHPRDERFEAQYAKDLSSQYRKTEIFGIEELGRSESRWDLDTAYLSLRAEAAPYVENVRPGAPDPWSGDPWSGAPWTGTPEDRDAVQRIENLLVNRPRALLRGEAGAGKTTLVWWLAAHAAADTLGTELTELNGLVPFVIPLREVHARGRGYPSVAELLCAGRSLTEDPPDGWCRRVMEAGRGLLLVDGLDEVPAAEREEARRWLSTLLDRYPRTRCLATVRPNAVDKDWLKAEHFVELTLLPMSDEDIRTFVRAWHKAARLECDHFYDTRRSGEEKQLLASLEEDLLHQLEQNNALRDLARTPLLCAVICALHRRRRGLLPTTRWSLFRAALAMLLGGRDMGRGVRHADPVTLDSDDQHALLQRLAIWLVRTGQQQMTYEQAVQQLGLAVRDMPQVAKQGNPERILRFLLDRSGLLQERGDDAIQFIHRTFQDFLAAKEFHESGYVPELLEHVDNEAWRDVIVLAVGHTTRPFAESLIKQITDLGDANDLARYNRHVLAARCVVSLRQLDPVLMEAVRSRVAALMPPEHVGQAEDLASLGEWAVGVQPDAEQATGPWTVNTVRLLGLIRGGEANRKLKGYASHPDPVVRNEVVRAWDLRPLAAYADEVLAGMHVPQLIVNRPEKLVRLGLLASVEKLSLTGSYEAADVAAHLPTRHLVSLGLYGNDVIDDLAFLRSRPDLTRLQVRGCPALRDFPTLPSVRDLLVEFDHAEGLETLEDWANLRTLTVSGYNRDASGILRAALRAPLLTDVVLGIDSLADLASLAPNPRIRHLRFTGLRDYAHMGLLRQVFPHLRRLEIGLVDGGPNAVLDLRELAEMPDLELDFWGDVPVPSRILGAEAFGERLRHDP